MEGALGAGGGEGCEPLIAGPMTNAERANKAVNTRMPMVGAIHVPNLPLSRR